MIYCELLEKYGLELPSTEKISNDEGTISAIDSCVRTHLVMALSMSELSCYAGCVDMKETGNFVADNTLKAIHVLKENIRKDAYRHFSVLTPFTYFYMAVVIDILLPFYTIWEDADVRTAAFTEAVADLNNDLDKCIAILESLPTQD
ncbi:MAG: hypothetical protein KAH77_11275 [Thiomargarita sp.]|nr:hypothetical protein [Thiomargarita sp.]